MAYQSLYRRYRPQKFSEIRGQQHVVAALQNAVVKGEVGHAYLLHGPRGTGKTTSARVLAKALNCENIGTDGEPCGNCESCLSIEHGRSFDLHELDAASNNKVEDMRDLLSKVNLGNPGRAKVYILDEVHMLTSQAENALLKTLEEPPDHVTWVLATTEPHKVVETIRSRCQVFELGLLGADEMADHVRWIIDDAALDVGEDAVDHVVAAGGGSARDTLSALDRVVAAGGVVEIDTSTDALLEALAAHDVAAALAGVGDATGRGRDPRYIGESVLAGLRDAFLTAMGSPPPRIGAREMARAEGLASRMSPPAITRALETLGVALVEMRQAPDPRVDLEVALVKLCRPEVDRSIDGLIERLERLEARGGVAAVADSAPVAAADAVEEPQPASATSSAPVVRSPPAVPVAPDPSVARSPEPAESTGPAAAARRALAEKRADAAAAPSPSSAPAPVSPPPPPPPRLESVPEPGAPGSPAPKPSDPTPVELTAIKPSSPTEVVQLAALHFGLTSDAVVHQANALLGPPSGPRSTDDLIRLWQTLVDEHGEGASTLPDSQPPTKPPALAVAEAPTAPAAVDPGPTPPEEEAPTEAEDADEIDLSELVDAPSHAADLIEQLTEAFPGAELQTKEDPPES